MTTDTFASVAGLLTGHVRVAASDYLIINPIPKSHLLRTSLVKTNPPPKLPCFRIQILVADLHRVGRRRPCVRRLSVGERCRRSNCWRRSSRRRTGRKAAAPRPPPVGAALAPVAAARAARGSTTAARTRSPTATGTRRRLPLSTLSVPALPSSFSTSPSSASSSGMLCRFAVAEN